MTDIQLYLFVGLPIVANGIMFTLLTMYVNARIDGVNAGIGGLRNEMIAKF